MKNSEIGQNKAKPKIIVREKKMVQAMVQIYCQNHHQTKNSLCKKCNDLKDYAKDRLDNCRYQEKKPVCGVCGLKCYNAKFKDDSEKIFAYSGPRLFFKHPLLGFHHILDALRNNGGKKDKI